jgi:UV DNA damage endonuclease
MSRLVKLSPKEAVEFCQEQARKNIRDILTILQWNEEHGIRFFRITSELFPHLGSANAIAHFPDQAYFQGDMEFARELLKEVGDYARKYNHRLTFHSNPYVQLGTPSERVLKHSLFDIDVHYRTFEMMGIEASKYNCLIVHGGGVYGDIDTTVKKIYDTLEEMDPRHRQMIVLENDEWHYNPLKLLPICEKFGLGFCFDIFHNRVSRQPIPVTKSLIKRIMGTWGDVPPKMHLSQQRPGERRGAHSDIVTRLPKWLATEIHVPRLDLMLECKFKEQCVMLLQPALQLPPFKK